MTNNHKIIGVAIKCGEIVFSLPAPNRHHNVIHYIGENSGDQFIEKGIQGFITNHGEFLNRKEAMALAKANDQLNRISGEQYYQGPELYSEDLW